MLRERVGLCLLIVIPLLASAQTRLRKTEAVLFNSHSTHQLPAIYFGNEEQLTGPVAVNDLGQVVVIRQLDSGADQNLVWNTQENSMDTLPTLKGYSLEPNDINNRGEVIGYADRAQWPHLQAFLWSKEGGLIALGTLPHHVASVAFACNENVVVGYSIGKGETTPALWRRTPENTWAIEPLPYKNTQEGIAAAYGISPNGEWIAGADGPEAVVWHFDKGTWKRIAISEDHRGKAKAVNDSGWVIGEWEGSAMRLPTSHAFLWEPEAGVKILPVEDAGELGSQVFSINNFGTVAGYSHGLRGRNKRGFLWSKVGGAQRIQVGGSAINGLFELQGDILLGQSETWVGDENHLFLIRLRGQR